MIFVFLFVLLFQLLSYIWYFQQILVVYIFEIELFFVLHNENANSVWFFRICSDSAHTTYDKPVVTYGLRDLFYDDDTCIQRTALSSHFSLIPAITSHVSGIGRVVSGIYALVDWGIFQMDTRHWITGRRWICITIIYFRIQLLKSISRWYIGLKQHMVQIHLN